MGLSDRYSAGPVGDVGFPVLIAVLVAAVVAVNLGDGDPVSAPASPTRRPAVRARRPRLRGSGPAKAR